MKLILVRHGQSIGNTQKGYIAGRSDPLGLSERGKIQVIRTAYELRTTPFTHIYTSPVVRAKESAQIINISHQKNLISFEDFTELSYGVFEGKYWWDVKDLIPEELRKKRQVDFTSTFMGSESFKQVLERTYRGIENIISTHKSTDEILVVSHNSTLSTIMFCLNHFKMPLDELIKKDQEYLNFITTIDIPNACIVECTITQNDAQVGKIRTDFQSVPVHKNTIEFYWHSHFPEKQMSATQRISQSGNYVYEIVGKNNVLFKLLTDRECMKSQRIASLYRLLDEYNLPVPKVIHHEATHLFFKQDVLVQDFIDGDTQDACLASSNKIGSIHVLSEIYKTVQQIHKLPLEPIRKILEQEECAETDIDWVAFMQSEIQNTINTVRTANYLVQFSSFKEKMNQLLTYIQNKKNYRLAFIHGDLAPANILIKHQKKNREGEFERLLDFERCRFGDPLWDLVYYHGFIERESVDIANLWKNIFWGELSELQKEMFVLFRILFHAWTVRDMVDYKHVKIRVALGKKSLDILNSLLHDV